MNKNELRELLVQLNRTLTKIICQYRRQMVFVASRNTISLIQMVSENLEKVFEGMEMLYLDESEMKKENLLAIFERILNAQGSKDNLLVTDLLEMGFRPIIEEMQQYLIADFDISQINYLDKNIAALENVDMGIKSEDILKAMPRKGTEYIPEFTAIGEMTICLSERSHSYYLSGNNNPYLDAFFFGTANVNDELDEYQQIGAGLLYEAEEIIESAVGAEVHIWEEDLYILKLAYTYRDLTQVINSKRLFVHVGKYQDKLSELNTDASNIIVHEPSIRHIRDDVIRETMEEFRMNICTQKEQRQLLAWNFRNNQKLKLPSVDELETEFKNHTMYLVAGGPSLNDTMDILRQVKEDELIVCAGTSAAKLVREGIELDYIIITDPSSGLENQIARINELKMTDSKMKMLCLSTASHSAIKSFKNDKYVIYQNGYEPAEEYAKNNHGMLFETGGSVSTTAFDFGMRMGCQKIVCLGLDLAYTNNMSHASGTLGERGVGEQACNVKVESVSGDNVPTAHNLNIYRKWIEKRIANCSDAERKISVVNISDGAKIHGIKNYLCKDAKSAL